MLTFRKFLDGYYAQNDFWVNYTMTHSNINICGKYVKAICLRDCLKISVNTSANVKIGEIIICENDIIKFELNDMNFIIHTKDIKITGKIHEWSLKRKFLI